MRKVLIFPLLNSMPSGHHQVADAICESIQYNSREIEFKKLDILSEWSSLIENAVVKVYLEWIRRLPNSYAWTYRKLAFQSQKGSIHRAYEILFLKKIEKLLEKEKPDLIVCTHGFPSHFINCLKEAGKCQIPCLNIYTDFFINDTWGCSHIENHFVPSVQMKEELLTKYSLDMKKIFVSGIPISKEFEADEKRRIKKSGEPFQLLLSGGSAGLGNITDLVNKQTRDSACRLKVLCGGNRKLYDDITSTVGDFIEAYPYISSKEEMNRIYGSVDAIISKPGGVTVSEAIRKEIPFFVSSALPGQEQINLQLLDAMGLVFIVPEKTNAIQFACETLADPEKMREFKQAVSLYRKSFDVGSSSKIYEKIEFMLKTS